VYTFVSIDSLVPEKFDDHSLIILHPKRTFNRFQSTKWGNNYAVSRILETSLIYLTFRRIRILEINFCERWAPDLSGWCWACIYQPDNMRYNIVDLHPVSLSLYFQAKHTHASNDIYKNCESK
jgi:hypothetical protein